MLGWKNSLAIIISTLFETFIVLNRKRNDAICRRHCGCCFEISYAAAKSMLCKQKYPNFKLQNMKLSFVVSALLFHGQYSFWKNCLRKWRNSTLCFKILQLFLAQQICSVQEFCNIKILYTLPICCYIVL